MGEAVILTEGITNEFRPRYQDQKLLSLYQFLSMDPTTFRNDQFVEVNQYYNKFISLR